MRNRAKCKLCEDIIESLHSHDYVPCKCGEIAVDGGKDYHRCVAKDWRNFLRVDDEGNVIEVKVIEEEAVQKCPSDCLELNEVIHFPTDPNIRKRELIEALKGYIDSFDRLPQHAKLNFITHYDLQAALLVIYEILNELCPPCPHLED